MRGRPAGLTSLREAERGRLSALRRRPAGRAARPGMTPGAGNPRTNGNPVSDPFFTLAGEIL
jgi:hypothetical protein